MKSLSALAKAILASNNRLLDWITSKVVRVLPGMQAAFIEIGLERAGFIHVADIEPKNGQPDSDDVAQLVP